MRKTPLVVFSTVLTFVVMLLFECVKEFFFRGTLSPWQSHWITVVFTTCVSLIVTLMTIRKIQSLRERALDADLKEEKIKSIRQVMRVGQHHVNNLANNLGLIQLDIEESNTVSPETLQSLQHSIQVTARTMKQLGDVEDPYDETTFQI